jgi:hypothetical protein
MSNIYSAACTPNLGGVSNSYTKDQINFLLESKANISQVYNKSYIDSEFLDIQQQINSLSITRVTETDLDSAIQSLSENILSEVSGLYATQEDTYTKQEVDSLISSLDLNPSSFIRTVPGNTAENTIYPGTSNATALTLRGSSTNPYVQRWLSNDSNVIGYVSNDGSVTFEQTLTIGRLVSDGDAALDLNSKRISHIGDPVERRDAVSLAYLQDYVLGFFDTSDPVTESISDYINSVLNEHLIDPDAHEQYEKVENLGSAAYTDSTDYATAAQGVLADSALQSADLILEREIFTVSTATLSDAETGYVQVEAYSAYALVEMTLSHPCRIRVYSSSAFRDADLSRPVTIPATYGSGLVTEVVSDVNNFRQIFTPLVSGGNLETPYSRTMYLSVTNLSGSSRAVNVSLTVLGLEGSPVPD